MSILNESNCFSFFYYLCLILALLMSLWVAFEYNKNEDIIEISYQKFDASDKQSPYPSMSLCFVDHVEKSKFEYYYDNISVTLYADFLNGDSWEDNVSLVNYDLVTMDINDYLIGTCIIILGSIRCQPVERIKAVGFPHPFGFMKCFSIHYDIKRDYTGKNADKSSPTLKLDQVYIAMNNSIFPNGIRPSSGRFLITFHNPFQLERSSYIAFHNWPSRKERKYHVMQFFFRSVEIFKRRRNGNERCYHEKDYDYMVNERVIKDVGCRPPFWRSNYKYPVCNSSKQMKEILSLSTSIFNQEDAAPNILPPCVEIKKIDILFDEQIGEENKNSFNTAIYNQYEEKAKTSENWFVIQLNFWSLLDFKEIKQKRGYSFQSVIGNASGYIGFLVGITVSELPQFLLWIYRKMKFLVWSLKNYVEANETCVCQDEPSFPVDAEAIPDENRELKVRMCKFELCLKQLQDQISFLEQKC